MFDPEVTEAARAALEAVRTRGAKIVTVESCTGGLVGGALTAISGSSDVVEGGYLTYSDDAKARLGVPASLIEAHGAVSEAVAKAMAEAGAATLAGKRVAIAITGVAGPTGGSPLKPVGLVHFAAATEAGMHHREMRYGDLGRDEVRRRSVLTALELLVEVP